MTPDQYQRFAVKVVLGVGHCWLWTSTITGDGYGQMKIQGRYIGAHVLAYEHFVSPVPEGLVLDHLCRTRHCVNPWHLEPKTHRANILAGVGVAAVNARKTHCPRNHPYDRVVAGERRCSIRTSATKRRYRERLKLGPAPAPEFGDEAPWSDADLEGPWS